MITAVAASIALATSSSTFAASAGATFTATIGDRTVRLPIAADFAEADDSMAKVRDLTTHSLPATYRLIDIQVPQTYLDKVHAQDHSASMSRYCIVMTYRNFEAGGMQPAVLAEVKRLMRDEGDKAMKLASAQAAGVSNRMSKELAAGSGDPTTSIGSGDLKSLGIFDEGANSIALATIHPVSVSSARIKMQYDEVTAMAFVLIHGKPVAANFYSDYTSKSDIDWVEDQARTWIRRVNDLNP